MKGQIFEEMLTKNLSNYNHIQAQGKQLKTKEKENFKSSKRKKWHSLFKEAITVMTTDIPAETMEARRQWNVPINMPVNNINPEFQIQ